MRIYNIAIAGLLLAGSAVAGTTQTLTLDVQNMTCATCPITVKKALQQVPGVSDVKIDYERKTATVRVDPDKASAAMLTKATADAGFLSNARK
ncbi:MAG: heavy-metal-associated domain-containing protein [Janthinobacterium lividum]|jgi:mercuric ion binding protein|uniref:Mercuric ion binding protein n=1 Tax=Massilia yuzhufengensis TaxID=1164594 RepID=A0A1I1LUA7_9BURK|nr:cation transporter [Massilia yuzhufengensis]SFC76649.1 mercuric ion binding protein [Massilia yuzhufengensis]